MAAQLVVRGCIHSPSSFYASLRSKRTKQEEFVEYLITSQQEKRSLRRREGTKSLSFRGPGWYLRQRRPVACMAVEQDEIKGKLEEGKSSKNAEQQEVNNGSKVAQVAMWGFYAAYVIYLLLLPIAPGEPVYAMRQSSLSLVLNMSLNFFFILSGLNAVGYHLMEAPQVHPAYEALFNFVNAWSFMFGPLILAERRLSAKTAGLIWTGQMFLTNIFLTPYMALRLTRKDATSLPKASPSAFAEKFRSAMIAGGRAFGLIGGSVGALAIFWYFGGRADQGYGGLADRWQYLVDLTSSDRIAYAFLIDLVLYYIFQVWLIRDAVKRRDSEEDRAFLKTVAWVPFFGMAAYLIANPSGQALDDTSKEE